MGGSRAHDGPPGGPGPRTGHPAVSSMPPRGSGRPLCGGLPVAALVSAGRPFLAAYVAGHNLFSLAAAGSHGIGRLVLYGSDAFALGVWSYTDRTLLPVVWVLWKGVHTIYLERYGDWAEADRAYVYDGG